LVGEPLVGRTAESLGPPGAPGTPASSVFFDSHAPLESSRGEEAREEEEVEEVEEVEVLRGEGWWT